MTVEQTHRKHSHCAAPSNLISIYVVGTSEAVVDIPKCTWCVPRDEALAKLYQGSWTGPMTVEQTHRKLSHCAAPSNLNFIDVLGTSEAVVDIPKCPWCVPRDEALANRFPKELDRAYDS